MPEKLTPIEVRSATIAIKVLGPVGRLELSTVIDGERRSLKVWETPVGTHRIQRRVENETMIGSTLLRLDTFEIPDYRLENVKWTQYFTGAGAALHTNYWRPAGRFGMPSSHGCVGLLEKDARWLWDWARVGTPLLIHY